MKRILCMLVALMLALPAAGCAGTEELRSYNKQDGYVYVNLGRYPQKADGTVLPLLWRVLTVDGERAYLCSEYVLFAMPMHVNYTEYKTLGKDFGQTDLCHYLNGEFSDTAFTEDELSLLEDFETYGKVFLLDSSDLKSKEVGMGVGEGLKAWGTEYAIKVTGLYVFRPRFGSHSPYWTRNQSTTDLRHARCTKDGGHLGHIVSDRENEGVRPAVYLNLALSEIVSGTGTMDDPYVIGKKALE